MPFAGVTSIAITGGDGNDTAHFDLTDGDPIPAGNATFDGGSGTDTIRATGSGSFTLSNSSLSTPYGSVALTSAENGYLTGGTGADTLDSSAFSGPVTLYGAAGNDLLRGGPGDDTLTGGPGDDTLIGGAGSDTYLFDADVRLGSDTIVDPSGTDTLNFSSTADKAIRVDLTQTTQAVNENLTITFSSGTAMENVIGGAQADRILGSAAANALTGGPGDDTLVGGAGNDTYLFDADTPLGSDVIDESGGGTDTLDFSATTTQAITVNLSLAAAQVVNSNLTLTVSPGAALENVIGGSLGDTLTGNTLANTLTGGPGDDTLRGGSGSDTYLFDADVALGTDVIDESGGGTDTLDFSATTTKAVAIDLSKSTAQTVNAPNLTLTLSNGATMENVIGGSLGDTIVGNALPNRLDGRSGNNILLGGAGDDTLLGGSGRDLLIGGSGADSLRGGGLNDPHLLNGATVFDDPEADWLYGESGRDWFLVGLTDQMPDWIATGSIAETKTIVP